MSPADRRTAAPDPAIFSIRITGICFGDAELRYSPCGKGGSRAWLRLVIDQPGAHALPYLIVQDCGTTATDHIVAAARAKLLRRGAPCTAYAVGMSVTDQYLQLMGVSQIVPAIPTPHHQPTETP